MELENMIVSSIMMAVYTAANNLGNKSTMTSMVPDENRRLSTIAYDIWGKWLDKENPNWDEREILPNCTKGQGYFG